MCCKMKKSLRISSIKYQDEQYFENHIRFIKDNADYIDEVALFTENAHHGYWDEEYIKTNVSVLKDRVLKYRNAGVKSVGLNVLCTIGHYDETWDFLPLSPFACQVDENGVISKSCICYSDENYLKYVAKRYLSYASTGVDFIWLDDDIRITNHGRKGCFCPGCIRGFNEMYKTSFNRRSLARLTEDDESVRKQWYFYTDHAIKKLLETIKDAVKSVNPHIQIGFMTIENNAIEEWIEISGSDKCRPGGGFYDERCPEDVFKKCFSVQKQIYSYPKGIDDIQYEYEAFNYQNLNRSVHFTELESTLALMSGCTGVLYNNDWFFDRQSLIDMFKNSADKWKTIAEYNKKLKPFGVYCVSSNTAKLLNGLGIPVTAFFENSCISFVIGNEWNMLSDSETRNILNSNVFTDGKGVEILNEKGFSNVCGAKIKRIYDNGMTERFTNHPLNGEFKNHNRNAFMNFSYYLNNSGYAYEFEPVTGSEVVSFLETITGSSCGCSLYIFDNKSTSKFASDGYLYPNSMATSAKKEQISNVFNYLSDGKLPQIRNNTTKIMPSVASDDEGNMTVMLVNASFDNSGYFELCIKSDKMFFVIDEKGRKVSVKQEKSDDKTIISIDNISPWGYVLIAGGAYD